MATIPAGVERRRFTVDEYYRMAKAGILGADERVELIEGEVIAMSPIGSRHSGCVNEVSALLSERLNLRAFVSVQNPIRLDDRSEPEPDLSILRPRPDYYRSSHPTPADVFWIVEVMDTTASYDRGVKLALYARSNVAEVWLIDLNLELVEVFRRPIGDDYSEHRVLQRGQDVSPEAFPDVVLRVDAILG